MSSPRPDPVEQAVERLRGIFYSTVGFAPTADAIATELRAAREDGKRIGIEACAETHQDAIDAKPCAVGDCRAWAKVCERHAGMPGDAVLEQVRREAERRERARCIDWVLARARDCGCSEWIVAKIKDEVRREGERPKEEP